VINGGFGLVIDGSEKAQENIDSMISWDVNNGIARRSWARNSGAISAINRAMDSDHRLVVTVPEIVDENVLDDIFDGTR
jgi:urocanate hydratase